MQGDKGCDKKEFKRCIALWKGAIAIIYEFNLKYDKEAVLYQSAVTTVWLVVHKRLGEKRILKRVLKSENGPSCLTEASILSGLHHDSIPIIYDYFEDENFTYLVEEYIEGQSLQQFLLNQNQITEEEIVNMAISLCEIFCYLHSNSSKQILYLDLKPGHVIFSGGKARLIDFGASVIHSNSGKLFPNQGTGIYMAPEQLKGEAVSFYTDVYAFGVVLREVLETSQVGEKSSLWQVVIDATKQSPWERKTFFEMKEMLNDLRPMEEKTKMHLLKSIAVVGSGSSVGTTHIAFSLCSYLNKTGIKCFYRDLSGKNVLETMLENSALLQEKDGIIYHKDFKGILSFGSGVEPIKPPAGVEIWDMGVDFEKKEADAYIYVVGKSLWQEIGKLPSAMRGKKCLIVCNGASISFAKEIANFFDERVLSVSTIKDPFHVAKKEGKTFKQIVKELYEKKG